MSCVLHRIILFINFKPNYIFTYSHAIKPFFNLIFERGEWVRLTENKSGNRVGIMADALDNQQEVQRSGINETESRSNEETKVTNNVFC